MASLKKQVINSTKWNTLATIFNVGLQFLKLVVLTRLLERSDFGLVAIATMVIGFTSIFSELGFTIAIIHKQDTTREQYSSLFWANVIMSIILYLVLILLSPLASRFYGEVELTRIIPLLGIEVIANAFGKIFQTVKMKELDYRFISIVSIIGSIAGFVTTVVLALMQFGVYSLVFGQLLQVLLIQSVFVISVFGKVGIQMHLSFREISEYLKIGAFGLGTKILDFAAGKIDVFLIGKFFGMDDLGIYNLAKELITKPYSILGKIVSNVAMSAFAKIQHNKDVLKEKYCQLIELLTLFSMPMFVLLFIFTDFVVSIMYGAKFMPSIPLVKVLCIYGMIGIIEFVSGAIRDAKGKTNRSLIWTSVSLLLTTMIIFIVRGTNIFIFASAISFITVVTLWLYWKINLYGIVDLTWREFVSTFSKNFLISLAVGAPIGLLAWFNTSVFITICLIILFLGFYTFIQYKWNRDLIGILLGYLKK